MYIGVMSGTSVDGIDIALVDFDNPQPKLIATHYEEYTAALRQEILDLCQPGADEINRMGATDIKLGNAFAVAIDQLLSTHQIAVSQIKAIGSHGQTIRHHPKLGFSLQIGDPNIIAARTGITTIADFRRKDLALGGQGAPLVPAFHQAVFFNDNIPRAIVNIGGIANVTLLENTVIGFDTGPGNMLLDAWIEIHLAKPLDTHGEWAAKGIINDELVETLLNDPFFKLPAPKSTGREYFNLAWLEKYLPMSIKPIDVQASLVELTARSILQAIPRTIQEILICGGGIHNQFLISRLQELGKHFKISSTEKLGIHPNWVEAMAFAWLAKQTLEKKTSNLPSVTGAKNVAILGGIYF